MKELEEKLQYRFRDPSLLRTALTHSSYINEHSREQAVCYERLEFLGDAVLGLTAAKLLYDWTPALPEGRMTRIRAELVCEESLCRTAQHLGGADRRHLSGRRKRGGGRLYPPLRPAECPGAYPQPQHRQQDCASGAHPAAARQQHSL